jgi:hypothetical protein
VITFTLVPTVLYLSGKHVEELEKELQALEAPEVEKGPLAFMLGGVLAGGCATNEIPTCWNAERWIGAEAFGTSSNHLAIRI